MKEEFKDKTQAEVDFIFYDKNLKLLMGLSSDIKTIKNWMVFFGIVAVIGMILTLFQSCMA